MGVPAESNERSNQKSLRSGRGRGLGAKNLPEGRNKNDDVYVYLNIVTFYVIITFLIVKIEIWCYRGIEQCKVYDIINVFPGRKELLHLSFLLNTSCKARALRVCFFQERESNGR